MAPLLEVQNLKKYFKTGAGLLHAVDDVSFTLDQGETLGVVGESGCGKTTLGRVILHLLDLTDGKMYFEGKTSHTQRVRNCAGCARRCKSSSRTLTPH